MTRFDKTRHPHTSNSSNSISCNLISYHAIDLKFSHNFVTCSLNSRWKFETDIVLLLRVTNLQTCANGCMWKPGFVKSSNIQTTVTKTIKICYIPAVPNYHIIKEMHSRDATVLASQWFMVIDCALLQLVSVLFYWSTVLLSLL